MPHCTIPPARATKQVLGAKRGADPDDPFETVDRGAARWLLLPACETTLLRSPVEAIGDASEKGTALRRSQRVLADSGLRWSEWLREGRVQVIKQGPHRSVYQLNLPDGCFFLKHYRIPGLRAFLQNLVRPAKACLEARAVEQVARAGIRTFEVAAVGTIRRGGLILDNFLISRGIEGAEPLNQFLSQALPGLEAGRQAIVRQSLAVHLGQLAARMHAAGLIHHDFHAGNLLVRLLPDDSVRLWVIDLHAAGFRRRLSWRQARANLAMLDHFFVRRATASDRLRFFRAYYRGGGGNQQQSFASAARDVAAACRSAHHLVWRRKDRHWRNGSRHVLVLDAKSNRCRGLMSLGRGLLLQMRDGAQSMFEGQRRFWSKQSRSHQVAAVSLTHGGGALDCYVKKLQTKGLGAVLRVWLGRSPVRRAWELGHALMRRQIPTPRPLAYLELRSGLATQQYLITEEIAHTVTLHDFCEHDLPALPAAERQARLDACLSTLAREVRWLHDCGFDHRDLKSRNILVTRDAARTRLWFLDLDAVRGWWRLPRQRTIQNLARLHVTSLRQPAVRTSDRLRFLRCYLGSAWAAEWKSYWRQIERRSRQKIARNQRHGRPLT